MLTLLNKIYIFFLVKYQEYKGKKAYVHKHQQYTSVVSADVLSKLSNDDLYDLARKYFTCRKKGLDDNLYYDCMHGDVYTIIENKRYNLMDIVSFKQYWWDSESEDKQVHLASVFSIDISLTLNPGYITVQLFDNRVKLFPLTCDVSHRFNLKTVKAFRPITPLKNQFE